MLQPNPELTVEDAARAWDLPRSFVASWVASGFVATRVDGEGRHWVVRSALAAFLRARGYRTAAPMARVRPLVFVVVTEAVWRAALEAWLGEDYDVLALRDGAEVRAALAVRVPDAIVVDTRAAAGDGARLAMWREALALLAGTLVVALTAHDAGADVARYIGAHAVVSKGDATGLRARLGALLASGSASASA